MDEKIRSITDTVLLREYFKMAVRSHAYELAEAILLHLMEIESK